MTAHALGQAVSAVNGRAAHSLPARSRGGERRSRLNTRSRASHPVCVVSCSRPARVGPAARTIRETSKVARSAIAVDSPSAGSVTGAVPSLRELRQAIPPECFEPDVKESMKYAAIDLAALATWYGRTGISRTPL